MNYIIIIAIVICLLIIGFSYFSSKHVNTIKENFSDSFEKIASPCYESDLGNCDNDTCMTASVYDNPACNFKENEKCSSKSLDDCNSKDGDNNRINPGCRIEITDNDTDDAVSSKCSNITANDNDSRECNNTDGCVYQKGVGCIDYNDLLFDQCSTYNGFSVGSNSVNSYVGGIVSDTKGDICNKFNDDICNSNTKSMGIQGIFASQIQCLNKDDMYLTPDVRKNKNSRIGYMLNKNCAEKDEANCNNECSFIDSECVYQPFMEEKKRISILEEKCRELSNNGVSSQSDCADQSYNICKFYSNGKCIQDTGDGMDEQEFENRIGALCVREHLGRDMGTNIFCRERNLENYENGTPGAGYTDSQSEKDDTILKEFMGITHDEFVASGFMLQEGSKIPKLEDFKVTCNFNDINKNKKKTDGTLECQSPPDFCFNITNDEKNIAENTHTHKQTCFPYTPENKSNYSFGIEESDASILNFPNSFFKTEQSTLIALKHLKCEDINGIYQKAKEIIGSDDPSSFSYEQKTSANNIIKAVENGEIASLDGTKKCKILTGNCYNKCENLSRVNCATEQVTDGECGVDGDRCKRTGCYEHTNDQDTCNSQDKCKFNADILGRYCLPKLKCGEGEGLQISATNPSTGFNEFSCETCQKGYYEDSNVCKPCPFDSFTDVEGATSCTPKTTCNVDTQYVSSQVLPEIPSSAKHIEYDLVKQAKFVKDRYDTEKDRQCLNLTKCEKTNDKYVENKDYSITPYDKKIGIYTLNELKKDFYKLPTEKVVLCQSADFNDCGLVGSDYESCVKDIETQTCKEPEIPLMRFDNYSCKDLTTCNNETEYIGNYQEMLDREFDSMFTMDRNCYKTSDCDKGHFDNDRVSSNYPIVINKNGDEMYSQDRQCATCQVDTYTDEPNMTKCIPQPTLGLGFGTIDYNPDEFESKTKKMESKICLEDGLFQDNPGPHRDSCKIQQVNCGLKDETGLLPLFKEYDDDRINCSHDSEIPPKAVCEVTACVDAKVSDGSHLVGL